MLEKFDLEKHKEFSESIYTAVKPIILYYVYQGRNAWWSTWVQFYYTNNSVFPTFQSAKQAVEKMRVQGSVFSIVQIPGLVFKTSCGYFIVTHLNNISPLEPV